MEKDQLMAIVAVQLERSETAIYHHPPGTIAAYVKYRDAFREGQRRVKDNDFAPFTFDEISLVHLCMFSWSFISSWHSMLGDKSNRNKVAHSCCMSIVMLGLDHKYVLEKYCEYEQEWQEAMKYEGITPVRSGAILLGIGLVFALIILIAVLLFI